MQVAIRQPTPIDVNFIYATWLRSYRYGSAFGRSIQNSVFFPSYNRRIDRILLNSTTLIACLDEDPKVIVGYLIHDDEAIHYAFTKEVFRELGIFKKLLAAMPKPLSVCTHETFIAEPIIQKYNIVYNPFILDKESIYGC